MHVLSPKNVILDSKHIYQLSNLIESYIGNASQLILSITKHIKILYPYIKLMPKWNRGIKPKLT